MSVGHSLAALDGPGCGQQNRDDPDAPHLLRAKFVGADLFYLGVLQECTEVNGHPNSAGFSPSASCSPNQNQTRPVVKPYIWRVSNKYNSSVSGENDVT